MKNISLISSFTLAGFILIGAFFIFYCPKDTSHYKDIKTKSGLHVLALRDKSLPLIKYQVLFPVAGADYSPLGKAGLSALTAYLLDQGAGGLSSEQIQEELDQLGANFQVRLNRQTVVISLSGLSRHKEKLFDLFKKTIISPHFEEEEMEILREQFLSIRARNFNDPSFLVQQVVSKALFSGVLAEPARGTLNSLPLINLEDVKSFYEKRYKKGNPIFMITGKFDSDLKEKFLSFVNDNFSYTDSHLKQLENSNNPSSLNLISNKELVQSEIRLVYELFPFSKENPKDMLVMYLANFILGQSSTSRLHVEIREKRGLTYGVYSYLSLGKLYGIFNLSGATKNASVAEFLKQALLNLNKIKEQGVTKEELESAKKQFKMYHLGEIETAEDKLNKIAYYKYLGLDDSFLNNYLKIIESVSVEEVNQSFKKFILPEKVQVVVYGHPSVAIQLKDIKGLPQVEITNFKDYFKEEFSVIGSITQKK